MAIGSRVGYQAAQSVRFTHWSVCSLVAGWRSWFTRWSPGGGVGSHVGHRVAVSLQLFGKLQSTQQEISDLESEHVHERQELEQTQNELMRELKLK